ncbi:TPA: hypothetical protein HA238_05600 [Candidatus Micrarchaeota archaeon]|nr:hypothetical protein [Candidatus Micrarchaeota archaeon]
MNERAVLCDSSALISLTDSCLDNVLSFFHSKSNLKFVIPPSVEYETILRPLNSDLKQYLFSAVKIQRLVKDGIVSRIDMNVREKAARVLELANNMLYVKGKPMKLLHLGEAEMIALANELDVKDILIDERTTRMLIEAPFRIKEHIEHEFGVSVLLNNESMHSFSSLTSGMRVLRSSEMVMLAYENGFFDGFGADSKKNAVNCALYKIKFSGCSIRFDEIFEYLQSVD